MKYELLNVCGFREAALGAMLSYGKVDFYSFGAPEVFKESIERVSKRLASMDGGHNKFLEQIQYWIVIQAPLFWWKQADTYRVGISKSSESTMHKSWKNGLIQEMFETPIFQDTLNNLNKFIDEYNAEKTTTERKAYLQDLIIGNLPDAYLQTRLLNVNAKCLRNMYFQRRDHKLKQWRDFCAWIKELPYGDLITAERSENR